MKGKKDRERKQKERKTAVETKRKREGKRQREGRERERKREREDKDEEGFKNPGEHLMFLPKAFVASKSDLFAAQNNQDSYIFNTATPKGISRP